MLKKLKTKQTTAIALALIAFSACARPELSFAFGKKRAQTVTTWIVDAQDVQTPFHHDAGAVHEVRSIAEASGDRCYSKSDDTFWRTKLQVAEACCEGASK